MKLLPHQGRVIEATSRGRRNKAYWWPTGLGKGVLTAEYIRQGTHLFTSALIVCPPHLVADWVDKLSYTGLDARILDKENKDVWHSTVNIVSYNKLILYKKEILGSLDSGSLLVLDEAHYIKNYKSKRYKTLKELNAKFQYRVFLSATFQTQSNLDLIAPAFLLSYELRKEYKNWYNFVNRECATQTIYTGTKTIQKPLYIKKGKGLDIVMSCFERETYETAGLKTPEMTFKDIVLSPSKSLQRQIKDIENEDIARITGGKDIEELTPFEHQELSNMLSNPHSKFFQLSNNFMYKTTEDGGRDTKKYGLSDKVTMLKSIIDTESEAGHKGLLLYFFEAEYEELSKLKNAYFYDSKRSALAQIKEFEDGDKDIFIANFAALGEGVRFKNTHYLVEFTAIYDYAKIVQGRGRLLYAGRKDTVKSYRFYLDIDKVKDIRLNILNKDKALGKTLSAMEEK